MMRELCVNKRDSDNRDWERQKRMMRIYDFKETRVKKEKRSRIKEILSLGLLLIERERIFFTPFIFFFLLLLFAQDKRICNTLSRALRFNGARVPPAATTRGGWPRSLMINFHSPFCSWIIKHYYIFFIVLKTLYLFIYLFEKNIIIILIIFNKEKVRAREDLLIYSAVLYYIYQLLPYSCIFSPRAALLLSTALLSFRSCPPFFFALSVIHLDQKKYVKFVCLKGEWQKVFIRRRTMNFFFFQK